MYNHAQSKKKHMVQLCLIQQVPCGTPMHNPITMYYNQAQSKKNLRHTVNMIRLTT
jgi:hypothetical protein